MALLDNAAANGSDLNGSAIHGEESHNRGHEGKKEKKHKKDKKSKKHKKHKKDGSGSPDHHKSGKKSKKHKKHHRRSAASQEENDAHVRDGANEFAEGAVDGSSSNDHNESAGERTKAHGKAGKVVAKGYETPSSGDS